jgi:aldoxime dehydratase
MTEVQVPEFVESDVPGREFGYPRGVTHVVFAQFGVQADRHGPGESFIGDLRGLCKLENGPALVERCHGDSIAGVHEDILLAYWTDAESYQAWAAGPDVVRYWAQLPDDGPLGYWREVLTPDVDRLGFIGFGLQPGRMVACTHALGAVPSKKWGYWGNYRDRFAASAHDNLDSGLGADLPDPVRRATRGKRVQIVAPNNLCFVREGAETTHVTDPLERRLWDTQLRPALRQWIRYLMENPQLSGAASTRDLVEQDLETGREGEKYTQLCYLLSLRHLERAARTQPSHVALYNTTMGMNEELAANGVSGAFVVWAESHILTDGALATEYVNCHPDSGLLPWFEMREL